MWAQTFLVEREQLTHKKCTSLDPEACNFMPKFGEKENQD